MFYFFGIKSMKKLISYYCMNTEVFEQEAKIPQENEKDKWDEEEADDNYEAVSPRYLVDSWNVFKVWSIWNNTPDKNIVYYHIEKMIENKVPVEECYSLLESFITLYWYNDFRMKCIYDVAWGQKYLSDLLNYAKSRNQSALNLLDEDEKSTLSYSYWQGWAGGLKKTPNIDAFLISKKIYDDLSAMNDYMNEKLSKWLKN